MAEWMPVVFAGAATLTIIFIAVLIWRYDARSSCLIWHGQLRLRGDNARFVSRGPVPIRLPRTNRFTTPRWRRSREERRCF